MKLSHLQAWFAVVALVAAPAYAADVAAGKAKAEEICVDCHGDDGRGDDDNPDIVKLTDKEFVKAIQDYQSGARTKSAKMGKAAKKLNAADVSNLAVYFATLK